MAPPRSPYQPDRCHFVWLDFTPYAGTEQAGRRPALVLSPRVFNVATGLAMVCPITNQLKGSPFEIALPVGGRPTGVVLTSHCRSLDWLARRAEFIGTAPADLTDTVAEHVRAILFPD